VITDQQILCFAPEPWESIWRNRHQLLSRLAQHNTVLWIEPRPYLRALLSHRQSVPPSRPRLRHVRDGLHVFTPPRYAPLTGREPFKAFTDMLRRRAIAKAMSSLDMEDPILWLCRPWQADVVGRYGERLLLYHVVDEYADYEGEFTAQLGNERRRVVECWDRRLMEQADLVIVTAPALLHTRKPLNPNTHMVRNGANVAAFREAMFGEVPDDMAGMPRPIIGCAGAINEKIDLELLRDIAQARPDWSLALIGPVTQRFHREQLQWLELPNVFLLGSKPVEELPRYVASCDVFLMPYKINEWTRHIDPLKLYEYLAAGKPIVSSAIPSATDFGPPLRIAHEASDFVVAIEAALADASSEQSLRIAALAEQHDWDSRVELISSHIRDTLERIGSL